MSFIVDHLDGFGVTGAGSFHSLILLCFFPTHSFITILLPLTGYIFELHLFEVIPLKIICGCVNFSAFSVSCFSMQLPLSRLIYFSFHYSTYIMTFTTIFFDECVQAQSGWMGNAHTQHFSQSLWKFPEDSSFPLP